jgi:tRNA(Ile)-lysidine synthetase-like protein
MRDRRPDSIMPPAGKSQAARPPWASTPFSEGLEGCVLRFVRSKRVLEGGERVLVAVSGGQDSTALLVVLARLAEELDVQLAVAHFDHMLRSCQEARDDEAAVRDLAEGLGLTFANGAADVPARVRQRRESVEEAARYLRFDFLRREARRLKASVVALGHTRGDRVETVLLHLLRGSGLDGLIGLRPRSPWPMGRGPALARPLLETTRAETLRYCREVGLIPREDPTNLLLQATRNRLRHEALPMLRRVNPRLDEALCRLGQAAADAVDQLDAAADAEWRSQASLEDGAVAFSRAAFGSLSPALRARLLRRAVRRLARFADDLEAVHIAAVEDALSKRRGRVSLPHGLTASVAPREIRIGRSRRSPAAAIAETALAVPGRTELPGWTATAEIVRPPPVELRPRTRFEAWLDADAAGPPLTVRSRRPGDRLRPLGLGGEKKLQDVLVDAKVPQEERDAVPLVCASWGIVWVVGHRLDERAALGEGSRGGLRLRFRRARRSR